MKVNLPGIRFEDWEYPPSRNNIQKEIQHRISKDHYNLDYILDTPAVFNDSLWRYHQIRQICNQLNGFSFTNQIYFACWRKNAIPRVALK
jgi:hypothetical protein